MRNSTFLLSCAAVVLLLSIVIPGRTQTNFYSKSTGNLNTLGTWGTNTDGSGLPPLSFTLPNQVFNVRNNPGPTISANWTVSGTSSKIIVGDGTNSCNFIIPGNYYYKGPADVSANGTLTIGNTTIPALGTLNATSTVVFNGGSSQTIPAVTYGNLTYSGNSTGIMATGGCTIVGTLSVTKGTLTLDNYSTPYTYYIGGIYVTTPNGKLDLGSNNSNNTGIATIYLSGNLYQAGGGQLYTTGVQEPNGTIYFVGTNQNIQQASSDYVNYVVTSGSTCTLTGNFNFDGEQGGFDGIFTVNSGGTLICGTYIVNGYSIDNLNDESNYFYLNSGGSIQTGNTAGIASNGNSGTIQTMYVSLSSGASYTYNGTAAQITGIFNTTPTNPNILNLTINNAAGVTLSQNMTVINNLGLTKGLLTTTSTKLITLANNATYTGGNSNTSYVNGPITKIGNQAFTFPVGASGTGYVPISISAPGSVTDAFYAQYNRSSAMALGPIMAIGLNHVSSCDYWTLNHTAGSSAVAVTGYWNTNNPCNGNPYVNNLATMALAHFSTSAGNWNAWGNDGGASGNTTAGSVTWNNVSNFSPFALSSTSLFNPLPITLVDFTAIRNPDGSNALNWKTEQEQNSNHFSIERSPDGANWQAIGTVAAAGTSTMVTAYSYNDPLPPAGINYYRLQIVDNDGSFNYSEVRSVSSSLNTKLRVYPNPANDHVNILYGPGSQAATATIRLMTIEGKLLEQKEITTQGIAPVSLPVSQYPQGMYVIQVVGQGSAPQTAMFMIRRN